MKSLDAIERTRRAYHASAEHDTVHRSSLLVPHLAGATAELGFLNHFLLKRGHEHVACRLTAVDARGRKVDSRTFAVREPRVHVVELGGEDDAANHVVEFFSPSNLFLPFPAAVVNHRSERFLNSVHSYNRVLNDVFEDDAVNAQQVREASVDVAVGEETDTFVVFTAGPLACRGVIEVRLASHEGVLEAEVPVELPRLCNAVVSVREVFGDAVPTAGGVLTVRQPPQRLFYGRMLAGVRHADGSFAANHTFYDCSGVEEYWPDGEASARVYPLLDGFRARVRTYPIFAPCELRGAVDLFDAAGRVLVSVPCEPLESPGVAWLDVPVSEIAAREGVEGAASFRYRAWAARGGTPRRLNHQVVWEDAGGRSPLAASAAISLRNPHMFEPEGKTGLTWGQCAVGQDLDTRVGLVLDRVDGERCPVEVRLFGEEGEVRRETVELAPGSARVLDPAALVPEAAERGRERPYYLWYWATCARPDLAGYSVTRHRRTGHCAGDHGF